MKDTKLSNSLLFLAAAREAVALALNESECCVESEIEKLQEYIIKEASDYEIMHLLVKEDVPERKDFDIFDEIVLFEQFKNNIAANKKKLTRVFTEQFINHVVENIEPVTNKGYSSAFSVLENVKGFPFDEHKFWDQMEDKYTLKEQFEGVPTPLLHALRTGNKNQVIDTAERTITGIKRKLGMIKQGDPEAVRLKQVMSKAYKIKNDAEVKGEVWMNNAMVHAKEALAKLSGKAGELTKKVTEPIEKGAEFVKGAAKRVGSEPSVKGGTEKVTAAAKGSVEKAQNFLKDVGTKAGAKGQAGALDNPAIRGAGVVLGALALSTLLIYGSYKTYQRYFSKAAKACAGKSGKERSMCIKTFQAQALKAQISDLSRAKVACNKSKNPEKCANAINNKIAKLQKKIGKKLS